MDGTLPCSLAEAHKFDCEQKRDRKQKESTSQQAAIETTTQKRKATKKVVFSLIEAFSSDPQQETNLVHLHLKYRTMEIGSPFSNEVESFNDPESFPDLKFVVSGMGEPLQLHKKILARASTTLKIMLKDHPSDKMEWMFETKNEIDKQALVKALRFCYGETLCVGTRDGECCALIAAFSRLQVTCLDEVISQLRNFTLELARNDLIQGVELLKMSTHYEECCKTNTCTLNKELAKIVLTKENMFEHFREVVDDCLMTLPLEYLDEAEYGEPHTWCSEFCLRAKYVRWHSKELSDEEKHAMVTKCDWSTLNSQELRELRLTDLVDKDELLGAHEKALECCEIEKELERRGKEMESQRANEAETERDKLKELLEQSEKTNEYMMEKNRLQSSHNDLKHFGNIVL